MAEVSTGRRGRKWVLILAGAVGVMALVVVAAWVGYRARGAASGSLPGQAVGPKAEGPPGQAEAVKWWTCAMHPQIRQREPGRCPICGMELIPVKSGGEGPMGMRTFVTSAAGRALMEIQTAPVERRFVTAEVRLVGKVAYDETRVGYITAWVPGRLDRLFVDYTGVEVKKGDHMVYIYSPELLSAQEELLQAVKAVRELQDSNVGIMKETAEATVQAAREKLRLLGVKPEQIAAVEERGTTTDHLTIYAPMAGTVVHKNAQQGMYVKTGTRIYTIADLSRVWVMLEAYESDLEWIRYGQKVSFTTEAYPGESFPGRIAFIDPVVDPRTRTVNVRVNVENAEGKLKPEMFVHGLVRANVAKSGRVMDPDLVGKWICPMHPEIVKPTAGTCDICHMDLVRTESLGYLPPLSGESAKPLVIPVSAALVTGTRAIVYVEAPQAEKPTFDGREIVLGPRAGDYYIVRHGLKEGELVVKNGNFKIDSALQILAKPSMMTPEGGAGAGGHHHGAAAPKASAEKPQAKAALPPHVQQQLLAIDHAYGSVAAAVKAEDLEGIKAAFADMGEALKAVEAASITGHALMMWEELSMLLGNDAFEGGSVKDLKEAREVLDVLTGHMGRLRKQFALEHVHEEAAAPVVELPAAFRAQLGELWEAYLAVQSGLAGDDIEGAWDGAEAMEDALAAVDMAALPHQVHMAWMPTDEKLHEALEQMLSAETIDEARESFEQISEALEAGLKAFSGEIPGPVYKLYCPMALDGKGAAWLQGDRETRNPYLGASMLTCGNVVGTILTAPALPESEQKQDHE